VKPPVDGSNTTVKPPVTLPSGAVANSSAGPNASASASATEPAASPKARSVDRRSGPGIWTVSWACAGTAAASDRVTANAAIIVLVWATIGLLPHGARLGASPARSGREPRAPPGPSRRYDA
jgi:hypothetical protein